MVHYFKLFRELISYQISLVTILVNLIILAIVSAYQFTNHIPRITYRLAFQNRLVKRLNLERRRLFAAIRRKCNRYLTKNDDVSAIDSTAECSGNELANPSIFFSNKQNDHQILQLIEKMDIVLNWVRFWPLSVREVIKHVEKRLYLEAEYASRILNHCQSTRSSLSKDELNGSFFDFRPVFMTTVNSEFEISNEVISNCEALLTVDFIDPLQECIKNFNERLSVVKKNWNNKVNNLQDSMIELRKNQKLYLKCALFYVRLTQNDGQNEPVRNAEYLRREENYRRLLIKAENEYKHRIGVLNNCLAKLERFKSQSLNEIEHLINEASNEVRRLTLNYITKLYPNQKRQLLNQMLSIVPEVEFRNFLDNLKIPRLPRYSFTSYDEIRC